MSDLLLNGGDLVADKYGDLIICNSEEADIVQTANNSILLRFGHNKYHTDIGNKVYTNRIKANDLGKEMVASECKNAILLGDSRVRTVESMTVTMLEDANCMVDYIITAVIGSTDNYNTSNANENVVRIDGRAYVNAFNMEGGE